MHGRPSSVLPSVPQCERELQVPLSSRLCVARRWQNLFRYAWLYKMFLFIGVFCAHVSVIMSVHIWGFGHVILELQIIFLGKMKKMKCKQSCPPGSVLFKIC
jgi:hypothetical protein